MTFELETKRISINGRDIAFSGIAGDAYFNGASADSEIDFVRFITDLLPEDGTFLDVGANVGLTSLIAASLKPGCSIIAVEAAPAIAKITRANLDQNGVQRYELHNVAAGATDGQVSFVEHSAYGHIDDKSAIGQAALPHPAIIVPMRRADEIVGDRHVDLIKIDVEGFEEGVLAGLVETEARCQPAYFIEYNAWTLSAFARVNPVDFIERILDRFKYVSCFNEHGTWTKVDALSCTHIAFRGFTGAVQNLVCSNDEKKVIL